MATPVLKISPLSPTEFDRLTAGAEVLERDAHGIKVLRLGDGQILKLFRRKRLFNRELLAPAALTFAQHSLQLQKLHLPTLRVTGVHRLVGGNGTVAIYEPLPGRSLRQLLAAGEVNRDLMYRVGVFIARLHRSGVYFRSLHPGNIIVDEGTIGLIDLLDLRRRPWSLSRWGRRRNWWHFLRCAEDRPWLRPELIDELLAGYRDAADLPYAEVQRAAARVREVLL